MSAAELLLDGIADALRKLIPQLHVNLLNWRLLLFEMMRVLSVLHPLYYNKVRNGSLARAGISSISVIY